MTVSKKLLFFLIYVKLMSSCVILNLNAFSSSVELLPDFQKCSFTFSHKIARVKIWCLIDVSATERTLA